ncbi:MAG: hypothetical protein A3C61_03400 [Candidatus Yanofskybacteria bacterium RIFCSPHIGHO2_02_FULL_39_10]|uniref:Glycosyl transferase n=1 Tax=Candidatus Yanofskybacteria bacterium RIFCSPHIGHO2_02_FULL_39_10 TaxID=1802674 RepID=A0A1F8F460_9BACT|nr:MAG: hypothetical protein A3C61_03400 [Candidatus Yanofskybacteria bacterium RIFCSPHIGHO2_02_FULL_39_10]
MPKFFRRIKTELFYLKRLLEEGYGPSYWWPYVKNRFFGNYLFTYLPRYDYVADPDLELHTICSRHGQGLWMFAWMLSSFIFHSKLRPVVVIHDDGTIDKATEKLIQSKFPNTKVMFRDETTKRILEMPGIPEIIKKSRLECHFFLDKLVNPAVFSKAKKIIVSDSDILFYKSPTELIDFLNGSSGCDAVMQRQLGDTIEFDLMMDDFYTEKYKLKDNPVAMLNGGYLAVNMDKLSIDQLAECLEHTKMPFTDYFIEMRSWACLISQMNFKFLPPDRYAIKGFLNDGMAMKHYTSPRRYEMFAYGIDMAKKSMR